MKQKKLMKRLFSLALAGTMALPSLSSYAATESGDAELLKEQLRTSISDEEYPNGLFGLGETQLSVTEGEKKTITVVRQGNTDSEATVRFKAIDVSAEYGTDYLLTVEHSGFKKETLEPNEDAAPLMESGIVGTDAPKTVVEETVEEPIETVSANPDAESEELKAETLISGRKQGGLAAAYQVQMDEAAPSNDWQEANPETVDAEVKTQMDAGTSAVLDYFKNAEGVETLLTFEPGEYIKEIVFESIDDEKAESDEQIMFLITDAEGAEIGASYNGYMNIVDNEEQEDNVFGIKDRFVTVNPDENTAKVTVERTSGIDQMAFVTVGTKSLTAVANVDYEAGTQELIFPAGVTEKTVEIPIIGDRSVEKSFYVGISDEGIVRDEENAVALVTIAAAGGVETMDMETITAKAGAVNVPIINTGGIGSGGANVSAPIDLRLAKSVTVNYQVYGERSEEDCGDWTYWRDKRVYVTLDNNRGEGQVRENRYHYGSYSATGSVTFTHDVINNFEGWESLGSDGRIWIAAYGINGNSNAYVQVTGISVTYQTFQFIISNDTDYSYYTEQKYTGTNAKSKGGEMRLGSIYYGSDRNNTSYEFTNSGKLGLSYAFSGAANSQGTKVDGNTVTFKGYQFKNAKGTKFSGVIPGLTGSIDYNFLKTWKKDYMDSNLTFTIVPVFEVKTATIKFNNDDATVSETKNGKTVTTQNAKGNFKGYTSGGTMTVKKLDTFDVNVGASTGFSVTRLLLKGNTGSYQESNEGSGDRSGFKFGLGNTNVTAYTLYANYQGASIKVMADPANKGSNGKDEISNKGMVMYLDENDTLYTAGQVDTNKFLSNFIIPNVIMNQTYTIVGVGQNGYSAVWRDGTLDDDEDGAFDAKSAVYESFTPVTGAALPYTTKLPNSRIYFGFQPSAAIGSAKPIQGFVTLRDHMILTGEEFEEGINGATITADGVQEQSAYGGTTKKNKRDGFFKLTKNSYNVVNYYLVNVNSTSDRGTINTSFVMNPGMLTECVIDTADDLTIRNAKVYLGVEKNGKTVYEEQDITVDDEGYFSDLNNGKRPIRIEMQADRAGVVISSAKLQFYSEDGVALNKDVAGTAIGDANSGNFRFEFTPTDLELPVGTTLRVTFTDNQGHSYLQRELGMMLCQAIGNIDLINSFEFGGANTIIKLIGTIDSSFDLGWNGDFDETMGENITKDAKTGDKILCIGFDIGIVDDEDDRSNIQKAADDMAEKEEAIAEAKANLKDATSAADKKKAQEELDNAIKERDEQKKEYQEKVTKAQNPDEVQTTVGSNVSLTVGFSLMVTFGKDKGKFYFKSLALTATVDGGVGVNVTFSTPIGIEIYLGFSAGGTGTATFVVEQRKDQKNPTKYYVQDLMSDDGKINIFDCDTSSARRKFDAYGSFNLQPYITISAGVGVLGGLIKVEVSGTAQFELQFYTDEQNDYGTVNLSSTITVKVLFISASWTFASVDVDLFGDSASALDQMNWLYESSDILQPEDLDYMKGGSNWKSGEINAKSLDESPDAYKEVSIADKIAADPSFKMIEIGDKKYAAVFTNVDPKRAAVNAAAIWYTICENGAWSEPVMIEDDGTLDQYPNIFDLGEHGALITWSSADKVFTDDTSRVDMQNSMNLHGVFLDKATGKIGGIQEITKSTSGDSCIYQDPTYGPIDYSDCTADVSANVSYNEKGLIVYYQKKEYAPSKEGELLGDVLFPDITVMAARTYDFTTQKWTEDFAKYPDITAGMSAEEISAYTAGFYGQRFFDFLPAVAMNETLDESGFWAEGTEPEIAEIDSSASLIIDTDAMSYNDLGVFAYTIDHDGDMNTSADRDVYMQIYDFETDKFMHPVVVNSDSVEDKSVQFVRIPFSYKGQSGYGTYLTWLHNGNIVALDMSNIVKNYKTLLVRKETTKGTPYYYINKTKNYGAEACFDPARLFVEGEVAEQDNAVSAITDFDVEGNGNYVYFVWTQNGATLKEGVEEGSAEALDPANTVADTQLYTARVEIDPETISVKSVTKPVQITSGIGANYSDVAFMVEDDNLVGLVYKAESKTVTVDEYNAQIRKNNEAAASANGEGIENNEVVEEVDEEHFVPYSTPDIENAVPYAFRVDPKSVVKVKNAQFGGKPVAGTSATATFDILNDGIDTVSDLKVKAVDANGNSVLLGSTSEKDTQAEGDAVEVTTNIVESADISGMLGGYTETFSCEIAVPEDADTAEITITVENAAGEVIATEKIAETFAGDVRVDTLTAEQTAERNRYLVSGTIKNEGNKKAEAGTVKIASGKTNEAYVTVSYDALEVGESVEFAEVITVAPEKEFETVEDEEGEGSITETGVIYAETPNNRREVEIVRTADETQMQYINSLKGSALDGATNDVLQLEKGQTQLLDPVFTSDLKNEADGITGEEGLQYHFVSDNESVVTVQNGDVATAENAGTAKVTMYAYPKDSVFVGQNKTSTSNSVLGSYEEEYLSAPEQAIYKKDFTITVTSDEKTTPATETPASTETKATETKATEAQTEVVLTTEAPTETKSETTETTETAVKVGDTITVDKAKYKVTAAKAVAYAGTTDAKATTIKVPATVKYQGKTYKVTSVADKALQKNTKVKKVTIGKNVTSIGKSAFKGCTALASVTLDTKLTKISAEAFSGCKKLKAVTITKNVTTIGKKAFYGCSTLKTVKVKSVKLKAPGKNAFSGISANATFKLSGNAKQKAATRKLLNKSSVGYKTTMKIN